VTQKSVGDILKNTPFLSVDVILENTDRIGAVAVK